MKYWWVNQNQTYRAEFGGGYIWSPKRNKNGARNQFYENMRNVAPGDLIFSFRDTFIGAMGTAVSYCYDAPKPEEFGPAGANWEKNGWKVDVQYNEAKVPIRPKEHIERIRPLLPSKYSPLQESGDGLQSVYLAEVPPNMASLLLELLQAAGNTIRPDVPPQIEGGRRDQVIENMEDAIELLIMNSPEVASTEKEQLTKARRGQGKFKANVQQIEKACRVTGISDNRFLIASHIKPWRAASNTERLDGENGLLLAPNVDFLFDRGFISFADDGTILISPVADKECVRRLGVPVDHSFSVGRFTPKQKEYLSYHRRNEFLEAGRED